MPSVYKKNLSEKTIVGKKDVLVAVLKNKSDLEILLKKRWYRIPAAFLPKRTFNYIAFYQPAIFGRLGKRIEYYSRVIKRMKIKRIRLLPREIKHPGTYDDYLKVDLKKVRKLPRPIRNIIPRRVSFGFTTLKALLSSKNILELYGVLPIERIVEKQLKRSGVRVIKEFPVSKDGRRCRIDLAVLGKKRKFAIECDNYKAHRSKAQKAKDKIKDSFLRQNGWTVIRVKERDIIDRLGHCIRTITRKMGTCVSPRLIRLGRKLVSSCTRERR